MAKTNKEKTGKPRGNALATNPILKIENNLSGLDFFYRKKGTRWGKIEPGSNPINIDILEKGQYLFYIDGSPSEGNSIVIAYKGCSHCLEILYLKSGNEISVLLRFIPMKDISNDIEVKATDKRPQKEIGISYNHEVYVLNNYDLTRTIIATKNGSSAYDPTTPIPEDTLIQIDTITENDVYEFRTKLKNTTPETAESCRYIVVIKDMSYTIIISENRRIEVSLYYDNPQPQNINITIQPD